MGAWTLSLLSACGDMQFGAASKDTTDEMGTCAGRQLANIPDPKCDLNLYSVSPPLAVESGGTTLTITGAGFLTTTTVLIDDVECLVTSRLSASRLLCLSPPQAVGPASVTVTNSAEAFVKKTGIFGYVSDLTWVASTDEVGTSRSFAFNAAGGVPPFSYSLVSGTGSIDAATGAYQAPSTPDDSLIVRATDSLGNKLDHPFTVEPMLTLQPLSKTLGTGSVFTFTAQYGTGPFAFTVKSGTGSIDSASGEFTAPGGTGTTVLKVTDSTGFVAESTVTVGPPLQISPATSELAVNNAESFSASDGAPPYVFSIIAGGGTLVATTGAYTAPATDGNATVRVTDSVGVTRDATITIQPKLEIDPTSETLAVNNTLAFTAAGGVAPLVFSVASGGGSIDGASGLFTAPGSAGAAKVRVTDARGNTSDATVTVNPRLAISPATKSLAVENVFTVSASGGVGPYTYALQSGTGSFDAETRVYTAPAETGNAVIRVTDSLGNTSDCAITVVPALAISPAAITVMAGNMFPFSASGGVSPYAYSIVSGGGSVHPTTGFFMAPTTAGTVKVRVKDSVNNSKEATVTVNATLALSPATKSLAVNNSADFAASGGVPPYTYSITSGAGGINAATGRYTAPGSSGTATLQVKDLLNNLATATVIIQPALTIVPPAFELGANDTTTFAAAGGVSPYAFTVASGGGVIHPTSGTYKAPAAAGLASIRVTDSVGNTQDAAVNIYAALALSPSSKTLAVGNEFAFAGAGGKAPYSFAVVSGGGTIDPASGEYTAPGASGSVTLKVSDSAGHTAEGTVTIKEALAINPATKTLAVGNSFTFAGSEGVAPYAFAVIAGGGTIDEGSGAYTAPGGAGNATVRVTDSMNNTAEAAITINAALAISPASMSMAGGKTRTFSASNGVPDYAFSIQSGWGDINATTGAFTAPGAEGTTQVRVTDSLGNTSDASIRIYVWGTSNAYQLDPGKSSLPGSLTVKANGAIYAAGEGVNGSVANWLLRKSVDHGATWTVVDTYQYENGKNSAATAPITDSLGNLFVAGYGTSDSEHWIVRKSADGGATWAGELSDDFQYHPGSNARALTIAMDAANTLYAAGFGSDATSERWLIRQSADSGGNWSTIDDHQLSAGNHARAQTLVFDAAGNPLAAGYAADASLVEHWLVRKSLDGGATWGEVSNFNYAAGKSSQALGSGKDLAGNLYVVGYGVGGDDSSHWLVRKSADNGTTWTTVDEFQHVTGRDARATAFGRDGLGNLYVAGYGTDSSGFTRWIVRKSATAGAVWEEIDDYQMTPSQDSKPTAFGVAQNGTLLSIGSGFDGSSFLWLTRRH